MSDNDAVWSTPVGKCKVCGIKTFFYLEYCSNHVPRGTRLAVFEKKVGNPA